ncbi:hypothetical protein KFK09_022957 [Dendrobium nobile]|uniref:Uncharacterized protein n=1 Tax=Dendrobium nobile TaxID=94219 RepID=A0A8T3AJ94_DENNO|nr:hypothetical protein KFK09_022957 [Dendrobium nobile]
MYEVAESNKFSATELPSMLPFPKHNRSTITSKAIKAQIQGKMIKSLVFRAQAISLALICSSIRGGEEIFKNKLKILSMNS